MRPPSPRNTAVLRLIIFILSVSPINLKFYPQTSLSSLTNRDVSLQIICYSSIPSVENFIYSDLLSIKYRLCGLVIRVSGYRSRGPGFDSRRYQISWEVVGLERGPLSLERIIEELLEWKVAAPVLKTEINGRRGSLVLTTWHPLSAKVSTSFANKRRPLGRYSSLADYKPRSLFFLFFIVYKI
jgi:hypothetical protein